MAIETLGAALDDLNRLFVEGTLSGLPDDQLLERFLATRDGAAFEALVTRHGPVVLRVCRAVLRHPSDAEDAFQATFLVLVKKAHTLRGRANLGGWLHLVAYRVALQANAAAARRRVQERRAGEMLATNPSRDPVIPDELVPALHEEIARLPEKIRLAVVLCDLQGIPQELAAESLRLSERTLRRRLADGRERLKARLDRRGLAWGEAVLTAVRLREAGTVIPPAWREATIRAALDLLNSTMAAGAVSAAAQSLTHEVLKTMFVQKLAVASAAMLGACLTVWAVSAALITQGDGPPEAATAPIPQRDAPASRPGAQTDPFNAEGTLPVRGRVLDPDGRPVEGASIRVTYYHKGEARPLELRGVSGPGGRFELRMPLAALQLAAEGERAMVPSILVTAGGYGPAIVPFAPSPTELVARLVEDDVPIEGRVLDLEGRPVPGASVKTVSVYESPAGDLGAWLDDARSRGSRGPWSGLTGFRFEVSATTGPDGRFRLGGIGRDRLAELLVSGPGIATARLYAATREGGDVVAEDRSSGGSRPLVYHGARLEHAAAPTRPLVGVVRDQASGRPLAGVRVTGIVPSRDDNLDYRAGLSTTTDAVGRYRLVGLPTAAAYRLFVFPAEGQPYPNLNRPVSAEPLGPGEVTCDFSMRPGVLVRGRLTDKATGQPVAGRVMTYSFADNPRVNDYPGFAGSDPPSALVGADGRFKVVALPGRGLVVAGSFNQAYFPGAGAEKIEGLVKEPRSPAGGYFPTLPSICRTSMFQALAEINPGPDDRLVTRDLQLDPGRTVRGTIVDPDGRPVSGAISQGLTASRAWDSSPLGSAEFRAVGIPPGGSRRVSFLHAGRKLSGTLLIAADEAGPVVVKLQPWGTITGRIITDDERPREKLEILGNYLPESPPADYGLLPRDTPIGSDGRFRIEGLVPGLQYEGRVADRPKIIGSAFKGVQVGPGESKDLGDLRPSL